MVSQRERLGKLSLWIGAFFCPIELAISEVSHGLFKNALGFTYLFLHPFTLLIIASILLGSLKLSIRGNYFYPVCIAIVGVVLSGTVFSASGILIFKLVWFGLLSLIVSGSFFDTRYKYIFLKAIVMGVAFWSLLALAVFCYDLYLIDKQFFKMANFFWYELVLSLKMPGSRILKVIWFDEIIGNGNKASNILVLDLILLSFLYIKNEFNGLKYLTFLLPVTFLLCLVFSRGAFLLSLCISLCFFAVSFLCRFRRFSSKIVNKFAIAATVLLVPPLFSISTSLFRNYWLNPDTVNYRLDQTKAIVEDLKIKVYNDGKVSSSLGSDKIESSSRFDPLRTFLGYGVGNYGLAHFNSADRMTHNLFVDCWAEGGVFMLGSIAFLFVSSFYVVFWNWRSFSLERFFGICGMFVILVLSFREYELAYLKVTTMGAIMVSCFFALSNSTQQISQEKL
jgi:hypothetical protein